MTCVFLDTAGRLHIDEVLMDEVQAVRDIAQPRETLLVVDGLTGQDAVNVATEFDGKVGISGVVLTRMDGDGRGGAALSMRAVTGKPIRFVGLGEKMDAHRDLRGRARRGPHPWHGRHRRPGRKARRRRSRPNRPNAWPSALPRVCST